MASIIRQTGCSADRGVAAKRMKIRTCLPDDWAALCNIHDVARRHELEAGGLQAAFLTLEQTAAGEDLFDSDVVVAEDQGEVCGFVAYAEGELTWLYVEPGRYRHAIEACEGELSAEVLVGNEPALALYLSEGFKILRRVDGELTGNEAFAASGYALRRTAQAAPAD
jgi:ribosomal protein S18 acetylase RimI-like enzyme